MKEATVFWLGIEAIPYELLGKVVQVVVGQLCLLLVPHDVGLLLHDFQLLQNSGPGGSLVSHRQVMCKGQVVSQEVYLERIINFVLLFWLP